MFYPTCSAYTKEAIIKYGAWKGSYLGLSRILRCHPWQKNYFDPVRSRARDKVASPSDRGAATSNEIDPLK